MARDLDRERRLAGRVVPLQRGLDVLLANVAVRSLRARDKVALHLDVEGVGARRVDRIAQVVLDLEAAAAGAEHAQLLAELAH